MDPIKILKRAWHIVWNYRTLWIFGVILALATSGSSGGSGNSGSRYSGDSYEEYQMPANLDESLNQAGEAFEELFSEGFRIAQEEMTTLIWIGVAFVLVMVVFGVLMSIARYVSEVSVIRMVDEYEESGAKKTFREGWRLGWSRKAWRLFLIDLLIHLPVIILLLFFVVLGFMAFYRMAADTPSSDPIFATVVALAAVAIIVMIVFGLLTALLRLLRQFFWRKAVFEALGIRDSLRAGFQLFCENWKNIGIMWLVMVGLGIAWGVVFIIGMVVSLPFLVLTIVAGIVVAAIPGLLLVGFFSLFLSGYLPWIVAGIFILPLFFIVGFSPWVLMAAWEKIFTSTVWTLVYRELQVLPELAPESGDEIMQLEG